MLCVCLCPRRTMTVKPHPIRFGSICKSLEVANPNPLTACLASVGERATGRKARGLQTEEICCKCQMLFYLSLKWQEEINYKCQMFFSFSIQI